MAGLDSDTSGARHTLAGLAKTLAAIATSMRQKFVVRYARESPREPLHAFVNTLLANLLHDSDVANLSDQVAQAITCGVATLRAISGRDTSFTPEAALERLPTTHSFLPSFFAQFLQGIVGGTRWAREFLPASLVEELGILDLFHLLEAPWVGTLFQPSARGATDLDPAIHLYEAFLRAYNAEKRVQRGVFYTPDTMVSFIVRAVDTILREDCGYPGGFFNADVGNVLDPATGTGTFLRQVLPLIKRSFDESQCNVTPPPRDSAWKDYVYQQFLPRLWGCEVLLAPFVVAHLLLGQALEETGFHFNVNQRLSVFLANALEVGLPTGSNNIPRGTLDTHFTKEPGGNPPVFHETTIVRSALQGAVFHVIIGNPPYARKSQNVGQAILQYMQPYKSAMQDERNIQALSDDYLKFLRLAEVLIARAMWGVVGIVLNNRFLTGPIYRGVRESLTGTFDVLYVLNLHGGKKGYEQLPPAVRDENVFPIAQGVCICLLVRRPGSQSRHTAQAFYHELFGARASKLNFLARADVKSVPWVTIPAASPGIPFVPDPVPASLRAEWESYTPLEHLFSFYNVGGKPGDDELLVCLTKEDVLPKLDAFLTSQNKLKGPPGTPLTEAKRKIRRRGTSLRLTASHVEPYLYRPFDSRWVYYDPAIWTRAVPALKAQCRGTLLLLCAKIVIDPVWAHALATTTFPDVILLSNSTSVNSYVFPAKVADKASGIARWNLTPLFEAYLNAMGINCNIAGDADVLAYLYAILSCPSYRARYDLLLRAGHFPRIPLVASRNLFNQLSALGHRLLDLHADPGHVPVPPDITTTVVPGTRILPGYPRFEDSKILISPTGTFGPVSEGVWKFVVGKFYVCQQWLSARVQSVFSAVDITRFMQILGILRETIDLTREIDHAIAVAGGFPLQCVSPGSLPAKVPPSRKAL